MTSPIPTHVPFWRTGPARCVLVIVVAVVLAQMVGCEKRELSVSQRLRELESPGGILEVTVDEKTGCQYLVFTGPSGGITPRMDRDGKQVCAMVGAK
jgi:hypothetical protein